MRPSSQRGLARATGDCTPHLLYSKMACSASISLTWFEAESGKSGTEIVRNDEWYSQAGGGIILKLFLCIGEGLSLILGTTVQFFREYFRRKGDYLV